MIAQWLETTLATILSRYPLQDILKAEKKCTGGKHSNVHLTGMTASNVNEQTLPVFVIGKSKTTISFKGVKTFHVAIKHNQNVGYHLNCLKNGLKKLIETLVPKRDRSS